MSGNIKTYSLGFLIAIIGCILISCQTNSFSGKYLKKRYTRGFYVSKKQEVKTKPRNQAIAEKKSPEKLYFNSIDSISVYTIQKNHIAFEQIIPKTDTKERNTFFATRAQSINKKSSGENYFKNFPIKAINFDLSNQLVPATKGIGTGWKILLIVLLIAFILFLLYILVAILLLATLLSGGAPFGNGLFVMFLLGLIGLVATSIVLIFQIAAN
ncbi:MAG: hypothetical protein AB7O73_02860 [Bacteroidia bacterium]